MITFTKIKYSEVPEAIRKRVTFFDDSIEFDDTSLTAPQIQKVKDYFNQEGYKVA